MAPTTPQTPPLRTDPQPARYHADAGHFSTYQQVIMTQVRTFKTSERCQDCGAFKREHIGVALVCPPLPESRPVPDQRDAACAALIRVCEFARTLENLDVHEANEGAPQTGEVDWAGNPLPDDGEIA